MAPPASKWQGSPWRLAAHWSKPQRLARQLSPPAQVVPQPPQFCGSSAVSRQAVPQQRPTPPSGPAQPWPAVAALHDRARHVPATQLRPDWQGKPQPPQFEGSEATSVQPPPAQQSSDVPASRSQ